MLRSIRSLVFMLVNIVIVIKSGVFLLNGISVLRVAVIIRVLLEV